MKNKLITFFQGFGMGITEIIPGVSGSSLAVIMGIYDDYIELLASIVKFVKVFVVSILTGKGKDKIKPAFKKINKLWGAVLVFGMFLAIVLFSNIILILLEQYPQFIFAFLFGLILASIAIPYTQIRKIRFQEMAVFLATFAALFIILGEESLTPPEDPSALYLFISGLVAAPAMLLPGISGSFVLFMLGVYEHIVTIIKDMTHLQFSFEGVSKVMIIALGAVSGIAISSTLIKYLFGKYESLILAFIAGLLAGSLRKLFPFNYTGNFGLNLETLAIFLLVATGITIIFMTLKKSSREIGKLD